MTLDGGQSVVLAHSFNCVCCVLSGMPVAGPTVPPPTAPKLNQEPAWHRTSNRDLLQLILLLAIVVEVIGLAVANTRQCSPLTHKVHRKVWQAYVDEHGIPPAATLSSSLTMWQAVVLARELFVCLFV